jgi:hypothetical protein
LVEQNWFGLNVAGDDIYLRNPLMPEDGSGEAGIYAQMSGSHGATNTLQSNVLVGFKGVAISVQGTTTSSSATRWGRAPTAPCPTSALTASAKPTRAPTTGSPALA